MRRNCIQIYDHSKFRITVSKHDCLSLLISLTDDNSKLKEHQLPKIQSGDPVARYYGLKRGQVIE